jgi:hypothetical protein
MKFTDLKFKSHKSLDGIQALHFFPNGYGVSIVKFPGSYGFTEGLYEVAVLKGTEENFELCYDTHITEDVMGHQDECDVDIILKEVEAL